MPASATNLSSLLLLGLFLGMRHATDADHIVAIATIVSRQRTLRGSAMIGAAWGVGHTITIMAVGGAIILFGVVIPPRLGLSMEFAVGIMLVLLGVLTLTGAGRIVRVAGHGHFHEPHLPTHAHVHSHGITSTPTSMVMTRRITGIRKTGRRSPGSTAAHSITRPSISGCAPSSLAWCKASPGRRRSLSLC
jgi:hypothetical protein